MSWWEKLETVFGSKPKPPPISGMTYEELVERLAGSQAAEKDLRAELAKTKVQAARRAEDVRGRMKSLTEACEFYANAAHWRPYTLAGQVRATQDRGHRARRALGRP